MKSLKIAILFALSCVSLAVDLTVDTDTGTIEGIEIKTELGKKVRAFLGIPYAVPPVGDLRFKPPVAVKPWSGTLPTHSKSKSCVQAVAPEIKLKGFEWWIPVDEDTSEDCLTLNIWVPEGISKDAPVMVWIHGGAYEGGTSASDKYDGQILSSENDVIVVSLNYRLNVFGFLYLGTEEAPGNVGLMDQALALTWVQKNIARFGGCPDKVTLFGQSAGGASASHHLTIPSSKGLFKRIIAQSGSSNANWGVYDQLSGTKIAESIAHATGCSKNAKERDDMVKCMRKLDVATLVSKAIAVPKTGSALLKFSPVVDGSFIPLHPEKTFTEDSVDSDVDIMLGATTEDGLFFAIMMKLMGTKEDSFINQKTFSYFVKTLVRSEGIISNIVEHHYTHWENPEDGVKIREQLSHLTTDLMFLCKMNVLNDVLADNGNRVYRYQFTHHPSTVPLPTWMGSLHGDELDFVFGWPLLKSQKFTEQETQLSKNMMTYWTNFAKYGDPNGQEGSAGVSQLEWPKYSKNDRLHLKFALESKVATGNELRIQQCAFWENLVPQLIAYSHSTQGECHKI